MSLVCPCCGSPISTAVPVEALEAVPLAATSRTIMAALVRAHPATIGSDRLVDLIYQGARLPADPEKAMRLHLVRARKVARKVGWTIINVMPKGRGVRGEYKLDRVAA